MKVDWDKRLMDLAVHLSGWSKDRSTKVGCVIVDNRHRILSTGYNGFPSGFDDDNEEWHQRPLKYMISEHSERNAIYNASRNLEGSTIYVSPLFPCTDCARAIIQSGIKRLVCRTPDFNNERWGDNFKVSLQMLNIAGIEIKYLDS